MVKNTTPDVKEENIENINKTEEMSLDDMTREGYEYTYISKGEPIILTVDSIEKDYSAKENDDNLSSVDYAVVINDVDGDKLLVNTWTVLNAVKQAYRAASEQDLLNSTEGLMLFIKNHDERGKYTVRWNVKTEDGKALEEWVDLELEN